MNLLLGVVSVVLTFSMVVAIEKLFKKEGLYVWISVATVIANIIVCKTINILGLSSALGNVMFASNFLAADILIENYSKEDSEKAIKIGLFSTVMFLVFTQLALLFEPSSEDMAQQAMQTLFAINLRTSIASIVLFFLSNKLNVWIFSKLKDKGGKMWVRNNVATIISNCLENYCFAFLAFIGVLDMPTIVSIATTGTIIEFLIALVDTPFLYFAKRK